MDRDRFLVNPLNKIMSNTRIYGSASCRNYTAGSIHGDAWVIIPTVNRESTSSIISKASGVIEALWGAITKREYEYEMIESIVDGKHTDKPGHSVITIKGKRAYISTPFYSNVVKIKSTSTLDDDGLIANLYEASTYHGQVEITVYENGESCKIKTPVGSFELYKA